MESGLTEPLLLWNTAKNSHEIPCEYVCPSNKWPFFSTTVVNKT